MPIAKIFAAGVSFLVLTIVVNIVASELKLTSWYTFLGTINAVGFSKAIVQLSLASIVWLFVGYPFTLGMFVYILRRLV